MLIWDLTNNPHPHLNTGDSDKTMFKIILLIAYIACFYKNFTNKIINICIVYMHKMIEAQKRKQHSDERTKHQLHLGSNLSISPNAFLLYYREKHLVNRLLDFFFIKKVKFHSILKMSFREAHFIRIFYK